MSTSLIPALNRAACATVLALALISLCWAQGGRGSIAGRVTDSSGGAIVGAKINIVNTETKVAISAESNSAGYYRAEALIPGTYRVTAEVTGFKTFIQDGVTLQSEAHLAVDIQLVVGNVVDKVEVTAEAPLLNTETATAAKGFDSFSLSNLPFSGGNTGYLVKLMPGIQDANPQNYYMAGNLHAYGSTSSFGTLGRTSVNEFSMDGAPNMGQNRANTFNSTPEDVSEMKTDIWGYDASVGKTMGAYVSVTSKSGTNGLHGAVREMYYNRRWEAMTFFQKQQYYTNLAAGKITPGTSGQPGLHENNFGGSIGGPVLIPKIIDGRNKLFFFFSYAGDYFSDTSTQNVSVPTAAERTGDFSDLLKLPNGSNYQVYDPLSYTISNGHVTRTPFAGNVIPSSRLINPMSSAINSLEPLPNNSTPTVPGTANFTYQRIQPQKYNAFTNRYDYNVNDTNRLFFRWIWNHYTQDQVGFLNNNVDARKMQRWTRIATADWVRTLGPTTTIDTSVSATEYKTSTVYPNQASYPASKLGLPGYVDTYAGAADIMPVIAFGSGSYDALGGTNTYPQAFRTFALRSTLSRVTGRHFLRAGVELRQQQNSGGGAGNASGIFTFDNTYVQAADNTSGAQQLGLGYASFLLGLPHTSAIQNVATYFRTNPYIGVFLQDDWHVTDRLTVNAGVRFEDEFGPTVRHDQMLTYFDPTLSLPITAAAQSAYAVSPVSQLAASSFSALGGSVYAGVNGASNRQWENSKRILPRVGLSYQLKPTTVLRAGYGLFYDTLNVLNESIDQTGFTSTTATTYSSDYGQTWVSGNPGAGVSPLTNPFPVLANGSHFLSAYGTALGNMAQTGAGWTYFPSDRKPAREQRWSAAIQRQLGASMMIEAAYAGAWVDRLQVTQSLSYLPQQYWLNGNSRDTTAYNALTANVTNPFAIANFASLQSSNPAIYTTIASRSFFTSKTISLANLLRAYPQMNGLNVYGYAGQSKFHSANLSLIRRFTKGWNLNVSFQKNYQYDRDYYANAFDAGPSWEPSNNSRPWRFTANTVYELPFGKGKRFFDHGPAAAIFGNFQIDLSYEAQPGPMLGFGNAFFTGDVNSIAKSDPIPSSWFNTSGFVTNSSLTPTSYNMRVFPTRLSDLRQQGINTWYGNIVKSIPIHERTRFEMRFECMNLFNRNIIGAANTTPTATQFGQVTSDQGAFARWIQIQGRLNF
jgi:hypothetical protein